MATPCCEDQKDSLGREWHYEGQEMTDCELLFRRLKHVALTRPGRSNKFQDFVRSQKPGSTFHHVFTATYGLKSSDFLGTAEMPVEHIAHQRDRDWLIEKIPEAIQNLLRYVETLEESLKQKS